MPRFRIRSLLVLVAVAALWLSTVAGYVGNQDVQAAILLAILVASGVAAISYDGRRRAFWAGFFIAVLVVRVSQSPSFESWILNLLNSCGLYQNYPNGFSNNTFAFFNATLQAAAMLLLATLAGIMGILIFDHSQRNKGQ